MSRLIDADALIEELNNSHFSGAPYVDAGISIAIGKVLDAPTIEARKKGRWLYTVTHYPYCSKCGWMPEEDEMRHMNYDFCPGCGSDMREEGDS